ncbi:hypothetical protein A2U01_0069717 [Trifolium medium]|uniref:Retrotransposon Copia-like N-terminal domain-containing protein n=1 Tax=Trifolium medium TaxID=97028 RepID=A0A392SJU7_9FABA|nr:hypothetical protein [Trifolium medium]
MSVNVSDSESPPSPKSENPQPTQPARSYHENHPIQITTIRMNGGNYFRWSQSVRSLDPHKTPVISSAIAPRRY